VRGGEGSAFGGCKLGEDEEARGGRDGVWHAAQGEAVGACDAVVGFGVGGGVGEIHLPALELDGRAGGVVIAVELEGDDAERFDGVAVRVGEFEVGFDARVAVDGVGDEAGERVDAEGFGCEGVDVADGGAG